MAWVFHALILSGLSPRVRGNPPSLTPVKKAMRSIPACAGEPSSASPGSSRPRVYPRVCGGTHEVEAHQGPSTGLSPRVRGNL